MSNFFSEAKNLASNFEQGGNQQSGGDYGNQDDDQSSDSYGNQSGGGAQTRDQYSDNKQAGGYGDNQQGGYGGNQQQQQQQEQQQQGNQSQSSGGMMGGIEKTAEDGFVNQGEWGAHAGASPLPGLRFPTNGVRQRLINSRRRRACRVRLTVQWTRLSMARWTSISDEAVLYSSYGSGGNSRVIFGLLFPIAACQERLLA